MERIVVHRGLIFQGVTVIGPVGADCFRLSVQVGQLLAHPSDKNTRFIGVAIVDLRAETGRISGFIGEERIDKHRVGQAGKRFLTMAHKVFILVKLQWFHVPDAGAISQGILIFRCQGTETLKCCT